MENQNISQSGKKKLLDAELKSLVTDVLEEQDRIIPIIGDDCFLGEINGAKVPWHQWIVEKVLEGRASPEFKQKVYTNGYKGLDLLLEEYKRANNLKKVEDSTFFKELVTDYIKENLEELSLRTDVKAFLEAGCFEVIVTTCPFIPQNKEFTLRDKTYQIMSFAPGSIGPRAETTLQLPTIYQIFGNYDGDFVFGEKKLLEFLHHLNQSGAEKGFGASPLVKYIRDKGNAQGKLALFMPIGCSNLPDWIYRFLWYPLSQDHKGGIWPNYRDEDFYNFLCKYNFSTFSSPITALQEGDVVGDPVLNKLTVEFQNRKNSLPLYASTELNVQWNDKEEWDLFISYASEDREIAQIVYNVLTEDCNQKVWMDNRGSIMPGDNYWSAIKYGIEHSCKFLFVISESYLEKAMDKNHKYPNGTVQPTGVYQEIELIKECLKDRRKDGQKGYVIPLIVEGTLVTYTDLTNTKHINEPMKNGTLELLPKSQEYQMLQTDWLFEHIQDMVCSRDKNAMKESLIKVFKH